MSFTKAKGLLWPFYKSHRASHKSHRAFMSFIKATGLLQSLWIFADTENNNNLFEKKSAKLSYLVR